ncbi:sperm-associated microtubule inner protein 4 [Pantherophis guttatus]|uniref:Sperm-associated microtubule inner protein 4 n=1 Tax=Pantherophis guttatus TaxID=94885 RepID=A0A6P9AQ89_PANGU|nr:sperm-associated microtubule inner protein 4 [Pantherophis guttatus]
MEVYPRLTYYNDVQDGAAVVTKTLESTDHFTPLHIPPGPPIFPERYEELRKTFQLCKSILRGSQEPRETEPKLPEYHRTYEPPYKFTQGPCSEEDTKNVPLRLPELPENSNSNKCARYLKYKTPGALLIENRFRPFHPYVHSNTDIQGGLSKKEDAKESIYREAVTCSRHVIEGISHQDETPKSTFQPPEPDLSPRAANILENVKKALWLSTYKRDYTGRGRMNPLQLDDYNAKLIGRATGELGKNVDLRESIHSAMSQVRPLEGRIARVLQGRISHHQDQHATENYESPLHFRDHCSVNWHSEGMQNSGKASLSPLQQDTQNKASQRDNHMLYNWIQPETACQEENSQDKKLLSNRFRKITDTWKTDQLYHRQLTVSPEPEPFLKPAESIYYEDLQPSHLNRYIVWHNPAILSKPASTSIQLKCERCASKPDSECASNVREIVTSCNPSTDWMPNCGMVRPQTKLLDIQDSFTKGEAIKYLNDLTRRGLRDLRDHDRYGRKHKFQGIHAFFL